MTSERRLDRLERMASLFVKATLRERHLMREQSDKIDILIATQTRTEEFWRSMMREQNDKINILLDAQIRMDERFEGRFAKNEERFAKNEERFERTQQAIDRLVAAQTRTDEKLQALIDTLRRTNLGGLFA